jgi:polyhydroxyalkanoate synthesis regulator phasin
VLDELKRVALVTSGVAELTRNRAEQIVRELVKTGDVRRDKASTTVKELLTFARENRHAVLLMLRDEVQSQIEGLGVVTKRDLERLERRIKRLEDRPEPRSGGSGTTSKSTRKSSATKSTAKKSTAKKSTAKKSTAKKSTARKSTAKKSTAKKSTARKSTAPASKAAAENTPQTRGAVSDPTSGGSGSGSDGGS